MIVVIFLGLTQHINPLNYPNVKNYKYLRNFHQMSYNQCSKMERLGGMQMKTSIRWRIIAIVLIMIILALGSLSSISSIIISTKSEKNVIESSEVVVTGLSNTITTFLNGYENSLLKLANSPETIEFYKQL